MVVKALNKKRWFSIVGWIFLFGFFFSAGNYFQPPLYALYSAIFDTATLLIVYMVTAHILFPRYYKHTKQYLLISLAVILFFSAIYFVIDIYFIPRIHEVSFEKPPIFFHFMGKLMFTSLIYFIGTSVSLIEHNNRLTENEKMLTEEKLKTELKLLKAQINPHFIFNALNNIYSLTYMKANNAPDSVLKLSEMLRYVFYDCSKERVQLLSELKYIENYIAFQQMKSNYSQNIKLSIDLKVNSDEIAPMLFIPFIENAFKYSRIEEKEDGYVNIHLSSEKGKMHFFIENSVDVNNKALPGSGTGIKNVQHRLNIIYPQKHELNISENDNTYNVDLSIFV